MKKDTKINNTEDKKVDTNQMKEKIMDFFKKLGDKFRNIDMSKVKETAKKAFDFVMLHKRYFLAGLLVVAFAFVMIFGVGGSGKNNADKFEKNKHKDVTKLIEKYYEAYAEGDREKLVQYVEPMSNNEAEYIVLFSQFVESFEVVNVYTQQGVDEGSYLVSVEVAIKFEGVETKAPGMDFFYVETGKGNKLYINNLYSSFNLQVGEFIRDQEVLDAIAKYETREELKTIQADIQKRYNEAVASDAKLNEMVTTTIGEAVSTWMAGIEIVLEQEPPKGSLSLDEEEVAEGEGEGSENEAGEEEQQEEAKQEILDVAVTEKVQTTEKVNVRASADTSSNVVIVVEAGTTLDVVAIDTWGTWTCVSVNGSNGYIRNDFLTTVASEHSVAGKPAYPTVGQEVVLTQDQNAVVNMVSSAGVIANLKMGATVTVQMSYANGWSKVAWEDGAMVGYVPTAVLKLD